MRIIDWSSDVCSSDLRDAGGHLHDGKERVQSVERRQLDGYADDREGRDRREHPGEVCGTAGSGDDRLQPATAGLAPDADELVGRKRNSVWEGKCLSCSGDSVGRRTYNRNNITD